ncbi:MULTISPECIES: serpin family protein [unclassified Okeania]|uniref:serpin family protein n=1 Tax=unclassified Okeania TaxID=2634635 RepID=UPI0013B6D7FB|nr:MULTISPECIES: serpin family protein [unclassified Okeania]NES78313.1 serpin family protein [Okeania sp. SIO1H4]NET13087.1 serpin family protein [Okeania sp. SIO1H6]NET21652.1 serpin family protein [Okeania sp. SIO1H5]NET95001.1 serpin family protein [Okeania sp. SIO1H2]
MFKELINKFSPISAKMSLGAIILIVILGVYNLPGSTIILRNQKQHKLAQTVDTSTLNKLVNANNKFGFQLFSEIQKSKSNENVFISPISIAIALSMTYNGAAGKTQEAMAKTLNFQGMSLEEINQANQDLGILLNSLNPEIKLNIANSIWTRKGISFYPSFIQVNQDFYQSQVREIDFDDPESLKIINNWVKDKTEGKIDQIIQKLEPEDVMVLLNAIYFQGNWEEQFSEYSTKDMPFYLANGTQKQHPIMFQSSRHLYYENQYFQAVSLPYKKGLVSMYIFLPREQVSLEGFYQVLNQKNWENWMKQFESYEVNLGLPTFKNEYEVTLNNMLKSLGMQIAFQGGRADFSGMSREKLFISEVKHKTFVEVNETGTEAAATTSVRITLESEVITVDMLVNRPFFFAIRDNNSGTILFMGEITNPEN